MGGIWALVVQGQAKKFKRHSLTFLQRSSRRSIVIDVLTKEPVKAIIVAPCAIQGIVPQNLDSKLNFGAEPLRLQPGKLLLINALARSYSRNPLGCTPNVGQLGGHLTLTKQEA
jgi:hypothetical protein